MTELFAQVNKLDANKGLVTLRMDVNDIHKLHKFHVNGANQVVGLNASDGNGVTPKQRRFAFALLNDIWVSQVGGEWLETPETTRRHFNALYEYYNGLEFGDFSLSMAKGNKTDVNQYINMLLDYSSKHDITLSVKPLNELEPQEIANWEYRCLMDKRCVICGKRPSEFHHIETVGAHGGNRKNMNHLGLRAAQLCTEHHREAGNIPPEEFLAKYHIRGITIDEKIAAEHRLNTK